MLTLAVDAGTGSKPLSTKAVDSLDELVDLVIRLSDPDDVSADDSKNYAQPPESLGAIVPRLQQRSSATVLVHRRPPLPGPRGDRPNLYFDDVGLPNLKSAIIPPLTIWPALFVAPRLETLVFALPDEQSRLKADAAFLRLLLHFGYDPEIFNMLGGLKHFEVVCSAADDVNTLLHYIRFMPNLHSLRVNSVHQHDECSTFSPTDPRIHSEAVIYELVDGLKRRMAYNESLQEVYLNGMFIKPGQLSALVKTREEYHWPFTKLEVNCPALSATECASLHNDYDGLDFHHIRNHQDDELDFFFIRTHRLTHQNYVKLEYAKCTCPCRCSEGTCPER
jgi:hypothetical protein